MAFVCFELHPVDEPEEEFFSGQQCGEAFADTERLSLQFNGNNELIFKNIKHASIWENFQVIEYTGTLAEIRGEAPFLEDIRDRGKLDEEYRLIIDFDTSQEKRRKVRLPALNGEN